MELVLIVDVSGNVNGSTASLFTEVVSYQISASSNQLGSSGSDRLGCDGLDCGDDEGLRVGLREGRLGYVSIVVSLGKQEGLWVIGYLQGRVAGRHGWHE